MDSRVQFPSPEMYPEWRDWANSLGASFVKLLGQTPTEQVPIVVVCEQQVSGTPAGGFTSGAWQVRALNTELTDPAGIALVLGSGLIRIPRGRYVVRASAPAFAVDAHVSRLYDVTNSAVLLTGTAEYSPAGGSQTRSLIYGTIQPTTEISLRLEHRCQTTKATDGLGRAASLGTEQYAQMELWGIL